IRRGFDDVESPGRATGGRPGKTGGPTPSLMMDPSTAPQSLISVNGARLSPDEAKVRFDDRGFYFGDGGYEVLRVYEGRPFLLEEHLARPLPAVGRPEHPVPGPTHRT